MFLSQSIIPLSMQSIFLDWYNLYSRLLYKIFKRTKVQSLNLEIIHPSVFFPLISSENILYGCLEQCRVLDIGTGSGVIALMSKKKRAKYTLGIDINPYAIRNAEHNLSINFHDNSCILFKQSDIFNEVSGRFDLIVSNPPFFNQQPRGIVEYKYSGQDTVDRILSEGRYFLSEKGEIRILYPLSEHRYILALARKYGYDLRTIAHKMEKTPSLILMQRLFFIKSPKLAIYSFKIIRK